MEGCLLELAKNEVPSLVNLVKNEAQYLCCFNNYVETFDQKRKILVAKQKDIKREFQKGQGVFNFKYEALQWECEANDILNIDTQIKKKLVFSWCPNFCWQYRKGRKLAKETQHIDELLGRCNSNIVAGRAYVPDIKGISRQDFIHFKSRESKFEDLMKALHDGNSSMIGLQGMGGVGKTSMAKEVAQKLTESNLIDKFIFLVVSQPPDFKKIRRELAKGLDIPIERVEEEELSNTICSRITNMDKKLLIILDDVWEKFDLLENLGIPNKQRYRGYTLLLTSRNLRVCLEMGCQTIQLQQLTEKESLDLFEEHAYINNSSRGLRGMPQKIVKHCGGVPIAIVAVARALKGRPISFWKDALKTLEEGGVDPNLDEAYKCLKLSYDNLTDQMVKELLLVSSMFPEDDEIPIKLLIRIGIGLCSFNENGEYHLKRNEVDKAIMELVYSSLLLNGEEERVKMHDLVREVVLKIGDKDIQSLVDLKKPIKGNLRYLLWQNDGFPDKFDGNELEVLLIFLEDSKDMNVSNIFFKEMSILKVLVLVNEYFRRIPALSLTSSVQPLKNIRTLVLMFLELGDISVLGSLWSLMTLWFHNCSINELPREFLKLNKLRSLEVEDCDIENNNPFEVIKSCSQLEELTFVGNECNSKQKGEIFEKGSPLTLHRYCISSVDLSDYFEKYGSMSRFFRIDELSHFISDATFQQLVVRAELLILEGQDAQRRWKNLVPHIVPIDEERILNDLIVLHLSSHPNLECLIDTAYHESNVTAFCNLAKLHLLEMSIKDLCQGPPPSSFLEQLEIMKLTKCHELKRILPNGNYNLLYLKIMNLEGCSKLASVFQPSTAQSLKKLEELSITSCDELENIIAGQDGDSNQKSPCEPLLPKLKILQIVGCNKLRIILPILFIGGLASLEKISLCRCEQLEYIFDKFQEGEDAILPSLREVELSRVPSLSGIFREYRCSSMQKPSPLPLSRHNSNKINESPVAHAFSWVQACCSLNKWRHGSDGSLDHTNPPELVSSTTDRDPPFHVAQILLMQSLMKTIRAIKLVGCWNLISLSTLSIVSSTMALENLTILECDKLKCITEDEGVAQAGKYCSIFRRLENLIIGECEKLEFLFVTTISIGLEKLKSLTIKRVPELNYVVENYQKEQSSYNQNQTDELHFDLPALKTLCIEDAPKMNSICSKNYKLLLSSPLNVDIWNCGIKSFTTQERDTSTDGDPPLHLAKILLVQLLETVKKIELRDCQNLISLTTLSIAASTMALENLTIWRCHKLKCITAYEDARTHMNYNSIFPKLKELQVSNCDALEYLIPAYAFRSPSYLESLSICRAPMLKYVFGRSQHEDILIHENQFKQDPIDFPTLSNLSIWDVPQLVSIYPENYYLRGLSPRSISLRGFPTRPCNKFLIFWRAKQQEAKAIEKRLQTMEKLEVNGFKVEEIFDFTHMDMRQNGDGHEPLTSSLQELELRNLSELEHICVGPKRIMCFHSLQTLFIHSCKQLKVIFSASLVRSLPMLKYLDILKCEELVHIVEEDYAMNVDDHLCQPRFPNLEEVYVKHCDKLKYLFSVTLSDTLPKLRILSIIKADELEHVLIRRGEMKEMVMKDVLPQLEGLCLTALPNLISICHGIDF